MVPTKQYSGFVFDLDQFEVEEDVEKFEREVNSALPTNFDWNSELSAIVAPYDVAEQVEEIRENWQEICQAAWEKVI